MSSLSNRLDSIKQATNLAGLANITRGIEKESLRVCPEGTLAQTPHPESLGSALTHPKITTDYSEALLEFITPPNQNIQQSLDTLNDLHRFTYQHIGDESLWVNSMPCMLSSAAEIPIARYGSSNSGKMKSVYRLGLGHRYGRPMQTIAGIHFNFSVDDDLWQFLHQQDKSGLSLTDYKTEGYFKLIRNFRRYFWILLYLFGAAPAICRSFVKDQEHQLVKVGDDSHSLHTPYATSLRMGDLGYQSSAQESLIITYNCLSSYIETLCKAITQKHPHYQNIGLLDKEGHHQQLNESLLQIENEFYSVIRPKRTSKAGQTALNALSTGGVEYIEVRCLDLNPFEPTGISKTQIEFLDCFLLFCLLEESPASSEHEYQQLQENQRRMVYNGRDPDLKLYHYGQERSAQQWGQEIFSKLQPIAEMLDTHSNSQNYAQATSNELKKLSNSALTPSAKVLADMQHQEVTFYRWAMNASLANRDHFLQRPPSPTEAAYYEAMAQESLKKQLASETDTSISFEQYLADYYAQYNCCQKAPKTKKALA